MAMYVSISSENFRLRFEQKKFIGRENINGQKIDA